MRIRLALTAIVSMAMLLAANAAQPYAYNFFPTWRGELPPGKASITWSVARDRYNSQTIPTKVEGKRFVVSVMDLFEEVLSSDTVDEQIMHVTMKKDEHILVDIREVGDTLTPSYRRQLLLVSRAKPSASRKFNG